MATQLVSGHGITSWDHLLDVIGPVIADVLDHRVTRCEVATPESGKQITAYLLDDGRLRLSAIGNDELVGEDRLTVRDERAVIAVGFAASNVTWGTFNWDWTAPISPELVASGIVRTFRDIYRTEATAIQAHAVV